MKKILFSVITVFISSVLTLLATEGIFRLFRPLPPGHTMGIYDSIGHHSYPPHTKGRNVTEEFDVTESFNNLGFRGADITEEKPAGTQRIFFLGDSMTMGSGVEDNETFTSLVEKNLREKGGHTEVLNLGRASYSPILHYIQLRHNLLKLDPDHVFLFYDLTDLQDDYNYERNLVYDKNGEIIACNPMYINGRLNWWKVLVTKSVLCRYIHNKGIRTWEKIQTLGLREYIRAKMEGKHAKIAIINAENLKKKDTDPLKFDRYLLIRDPDYLPAVKTHWARSGKYLLMIRDLLAERGVGFTFALVPHGPQISKDQWITGKIAWGFAPGKVYDDPYAMDYIRTWAEENSIPFMDTLPVMKQHAHDKLYFNKDFHMTPAGHAAYAEAILKNPVFQQVMQMLALHRDIA